MDDRIIQPVTGDAIDLIDDAVPDGMLGEVVQHLLERFAAGRLAGLAGLDELRDDDRIQLRGLAVGGLSLRGDGQALFEAVAGGLVLGGDPQIRDRGHLPVGEGDVEGLAGDVGEGAQGSEVDALWEVEERHGRDVPFGLSPTPETGSGAGAERLSRHRWKGPAEPRRVRATEGKPGAP
nr:hypothetical protein [Brevibacterium luteolum]